jgi:hypothetical protein
MSEPIHERVWPSVGLTRRVNLGNYEHCEVRVVVFDEDENVALSRCITLINKFLRLVDKPQIEVAKV